MASETEITFGSEIADYTVEGLIGRGGMGEVFRALDRRLARAVALKVLAPQFAGDSAFRDRILRESQLAASIDHPNVIPIYAAGEADGQVYIAMRLVEGPDLRAVLRDEHRLESTRALSLISQVAEALDAAHSRGLVHRDVKPSNVLIDAHAGKEHCYLADFGITTRASDHPAADVSQQMLGTLAYVAPEQIRGDSVDQRADVYSLGCLLFQCLTGELPFVRESDIAVVFAHLEDPPPKPSERAPELPPEIDDVISRALHKDPESRYATCAQLVEDARGALGVPERGGHRRRVFASALAIGLAAVVAVAAVAAFRHTSASPPPPTGSVVRIDPATNAVTASYRLSAHPEAVVVGKRVWAVDFRAGMVWYVDPQSGEVGSFASTGSPRGVALAGPYLYVGADGPSALGGNVTRFDALTGARLGYVLLVTCSIAGGEGVVYAAGCPDVQRISTSGAMRILHTTKIPFPSPQNAAHTRVAMMGMAVGEGAVWVIGDALDRRVFKLALRTGQLLGAFDVPVAPQAIASGEGGVWVTDGIDDRVLELDPATGRVVRTVPTGRGTDGVAVGAGSVWVVSAIDRHITRIDPANGRIVARIAVDGAPHFAAVGPSGLWVTTDAP